MDLLIFDLDGTLIDPRADIAASVNLTLREIGLPPKPPEFIIRTMGCGMRWLLEQAVSPHETLPIEEILPIFGRHYRDHLLDRTTLYPQVRETLNFFRNRRMAVVTNKPLEYATAILQGLGIRDYFKMVLGGDSTPNPKPDPEMIRKTVENLRVNHGRTLMIGDGISDILAARAAGVPCCAVAYGLTDPGLLLRENPDFFCHTLGEIRRISLKNPPVKSVRLQSS